MVHSHRRVRRVGLCRRRWLHRSFHHAFPSNERLKSEVTSVSEQQKRKVNDAHHRIWVSSVLSLCERWHSGVDRYLGTLFRFHHQCCWGSWKAKARQSMRERRRKTRDDVQFVNHLFEFAASNVAGHDFHHFLTNGFDLRKHQVDSIEDCHHWLACVGHSRSFWFDHAFSWWNQCRRLARDIRRMYEHQREPRSVSKRDDRVHWSLFRRGDRRIYLPFLDKHTKTIGGNVHAMKVGQTMTTLDIFTDQFEFTITIFVVVLN